MPVLRNTFAVNGLIARIAFKVLSLRYSVRLNGLKRILKKGRKGILLLANHPAFIDPMIMVTALYPVFRLRPFAIRETSDLPVVMWFLERIDSVTVPELTPQNVRRAGVEIGRALETVAAGLAEGGNFLLYPSGELAKGPEESLGNKGAVEKILRAAPDVRVVLVRTRGLRGSSFSYGRGRRPDALRAALRGVVRAVMSGFLFMPRRRVEIDFYEPEDFPRRNGRREMNRFMEEYYNSAAGR